MQRITSLFFSDILNKEVYFKDAFLIGRVKDIITLAEEEMPRIVSVQVKKADDSLIKLDWVDVEIVKKDKKIILICTDITEFSSDEPLIFLSHHLLDKQIVDINGKKVVRINDIQLAEVGGEMRVVAADIGFTGLIRRLEFEGAAKKFFSFLGKGLKDNLITWESVETLDVGNDSIKLTVPYKKLKTLHPADIADIIESLDSKHGAEVLESLDDDIAAETLEEIEHDMQISIMDNLDEERASEILENMDADEVADILEDLEESHVEKILSFMEEEDSEEIRELMKYEEDTVGSLMTTEYFTFSPDLSVEEAINELRRIKPDSDMTYYIYVTDRGEHLIGIVSLRNLIVSDASTKLSEIMNSRVISVRDTDSIEDLIDIVAKYNFLAVPVVDEENVLVGIAVINDLVYDLLLKKRKFSVGR